MKITLKFPKHKNDATKVNLQFSKKHYQSDQRTYHQILKLSKQFHMQPGELVTKHVLAELFGHN